MAEQTKEIPTIINNINVDQTLIMDLKTTGNNIHKTTFYGVNNYNYANCLEMVMDDNKGVYFYFAIYNEKRNELEIFSDKYYLQSEQWKEYQDKTKKPVSQTIKKELANLLVEEKCKDIKFVSLYDVLK